MGKRKMKKRKSQPIIIAIIAIILAVVAAIAIFAFVLPAVQAQKNVELFKNIDADLQTRSADIPNFQLNSDTIEHEKLVNGKYASYFKGTLLSYSGVGYISKYEDSNQTDFIWNYTANESSSSDASEEYKQIIKAFNDSFGEGTAGFYSLNMGTSGQDAIDNYEYHKDRFHSEEKSYDSSETFVDATATYFTTTGTYDYAVMFYKNYVYVYQIAK